MPIYRTGKFVTKEQRITALTGHKKRSFIKKSFLNLVQNAPLEFVESNLSFPIKSHVKNLARKINPVVVDFGCGKGQASAEIAKDVPKSRVYGFSDTSYRNWNRIINGNTEKGVPPRHNIKFIHAEAKDFPRYFKDNSIDIVYSHLGLMHTPNQMEYLRQLIPKLKKSGIIVTDIDWDIQNFTPLIGNQKPIIEKRNEPLYEYQVEIYSQPNYKVEINKYRSTIIIKRTK